MRRCRVYKGSFDGQTARVPASPEPLRSTAPNPPEISQTIWLLAIAAVASSMSMRLADPMLPKIALTFGGVATDMAGVSTWFSVGYAMLIIVQGPLGDRLGKLNVIMVSSFIAALASLACVLAPALTPLNLFRFINGAACAGLIPLSLAWIGDNVDIASRQQTLAGFASATISGMVLGQVCGGIIADTIGWRYAFAVPAMVYLIACVALWRSHGFSASPTPSGDQTKANGLRHACVDTARKYRKLLGDRWSRTVMSTVWLEGALYYGVIAFVPTFLHEVLGVPLWQAGGLVALIGLGGFIFSASARIILKRLSLSRCAAVGGSLYTVGIWMLVGAVSYSGALGNLGWLPITVGCLGVGMGFTMLHNTLQTNATQMQPEARGTAIAGFVIALFTGQAIGIAISAELIPLAGYQATLSGMALGLGALSLLFASRIRRRQATNSTG